MNPICDNCKFWTPNGSPLKVGYCHKEKYAYRKHNQSCKKHEFRDSLFYTGIYGEPCDGPAEFDTL